MKKFNADPYYTNSTHLHVSYTDDIFTALDLQDDLQVKYTGGTVLHGYIGERLPNGDAAKKLVKKIVNNYRLPYFTITPTFSICRNMAIFRVNINIVRNVMQRLVIRKQLMKLG